MYGRGILMYPVYYVRKAQKNLFEIEWIIVLRNQWINLCPENCIISQIPIACSDRKWFLIKAYFQYLLKQVLKRLLVGQIQKLYIFSEKKGIGQTFTSNEA